MDEDKLRRFLEVAKASDCPDGCKCHKLDPKQLCKARRTGLDVLLECLEEHPEDCDFSMSFGGSYYCKCKTRMELAKLLGE